MRHALREGIARWRHAVGDVQLTPARVAGVYLLVGLGGLYVSDVVLPALVGSDALLARLQLVKGVLEVGATAVVLYAVTAWSWRSLRETNEDLDAARQGLSVLHRIFRHNLRNDVTVVAGHAESLEQAVDRQPLVEHCTAIRDSCAELIGYTEKAKLVADLDQGEVETQEVDLAAAFASVRRRIERRHDDVEFDVSIPEGATVLAHEYVEFALLETVDNAVVHHDADRPTIRVAVREAPSYGGWLELTVEDDGPGIPPEEATSLEMGEQPLEHSSGVGLWMASWIVYRSGGDFDVETTPEGSRVTIALPTPSTTAAPRAEVALDRFLA